MIELKKYVLNKQAEWEREIPIKELVEKTGISRATITRLLSSSKKQTRIDEATISALCKFFKVEPGSPVPFLLYTPTKEQ